MTLVSRVRASSALLALALVTAAPAFAASPASEPVIAVEKALPAPVAYRTVDVDGVKVFYREAGRRDAPAVLLLHGFPTSSHMFRNLIPQLADSFRVVAPDLPGFGLTEVPAGAAYSYTFASLAKTIDRFTEEVGLKRFAIYVFDYGAPTGLRIAIEHPDRVTAIISQNGNAYLEGLGDAWNPIRAYWQDPSQANRDALRPFMKLDITKWQYTNGEPDPSRIAPESYLFDQALLDRPGNIEIQLDLFGDYKSNVALYPKFQEYFRSRKPPLLAAWGKNDPFFLPPGALAFTRDNPNAVVKFYDAGHFALESHTQEIGRDIKSFLKRALVTK